MHIACSSDSPTHYGDGSGSTTVPTCISHWIPCLRSIIDSFKGQKGKASRLQRSLKRIRKVFSRFTWPDFPSRTTLHFSRGPYLPNSFSKSLDDIKIHPEVFLTVDSNEEWWWKFHCRLAIPIHFRQLELEKLFGLALGFPMHGLDLENPTRDLGLVFGPWHRTILALHSWLWLTPLFTLRIKMEWGGGGDLMDSV